MSLLAGFGETKYLDLFKKHVTDSSYSVSGAALEGLTYMDSGAAMTEVRKMKGQKVKGRLQESVTRLKMMAGSEPEFEEASGSFGKMPFSQGKFSLIQPFTQMLIRMKETEKVKKGVDMIVDFRDEIPAEFGVTSYINNLLNNVAARKQNVSDVAAKEQVDYIKSKLKN